MSQTPQDKQLIVSILWPSHRFTFLGAKPPPPTAHCQSQEGGDVNEDKTKRFSVFVQNIYLTFKFNMLYTAEESNCNF